MAKQVIEYRCLLISPGDVSEERDALTDLIGSWNAQVGKGLNVRVDLVRWESHSTPDMSKPAQAALNEQIVDDCDLGIAVFWSKLGTATANHASGSVEEIYRLLSRDVRVLVYFATKDIPQTALKDDQYPKLQETKKSFRDKGLLGNYDSIAHLREQVNLHLTSVISEMLGKDRTHATFVPTAGTMTAPTPDVRVTVNPGFVTNHFGSLTQVLTVSVQNLSPVSVFMNGVGFELLDGRTLLIQRDFITGEQLLAKRELRSGDGMSFYFDPEKLFEHAAQIANAMAKDAAGRVYRTKDAKVADMIEALHETNQDE